MSVFVLVLMIGYRVLTLAAVAAMGGSIWRTLHRRHDGWMRGRHISLPLVRRLGWLGARMFRVLLTIAALLAFLFDVSPGLVVARVINVILCLWFIDDYLTGGDPPRRKRLRDWAKSKLKKLERIRLRPVEHWQPQPVPA